MMMKIKKCMHKNCERLNLPNGIENGDKNFHQNRNTMYLFIKKTYQTNNNDTSNRIPSYGTILKFKSLLDIYIYNSSYRNRNK